MTRDEMIKKAKEIIADGCACDRGCEELIGPDVYCGCGRDAARIVGMVLASTKPKWRDVDEEPYPPRNEDVLMSWKNWADDRWEYEAGWAGSVQGGWLHGQATHWMPLPKPPAEDAEK